MTFYDLCFKYSVCVDLHEYKSKLLGVNCEFPLGIRHVIFFPQLRSASERVAIAMQLFRLGGTIISLLGHPYITSDEIGLR